ncbi:hypothetical protein BpHYR1_013090 [Brachionus plicatilis]|uniref:Uncharacterized protein n=1 Tax=Brachionus plicatilis TaxID=10195 RepID=A0A3M7SFA1_BRAPC|nr:hypothetical protein BpHYR1_013090 [Brachionus plicatilis]
MFATDSLSSSHPNLLREDGDLLRLMIWAIQPENEYRIAFLLAFPRRPTIKSYRNNISYY